MSARGELVTFDSPLEEARSALSGQYTVLSAGGAGIAVRDELDKLVCRITISAPPGGSFWLSLEPLRGYAGDAERIRERLLAAGFASEKSWKSAQVPMAADERADIAVGRVLLRLLQIMDANLPGALADADVEFLHDYRVAIRRTRSVLRQMRDVFDPKELERIRAEFKWLQDQTSVTRDLDVYLQEFAQLRELAPATVRADLEPIEPLLRERHSRAQAAMRAALTGGRARTLRNDWWEVLEALVLAGHESRGDAGQPIGRLAAHRIVKVHRKMVKMGEAIKPNSDPDDYHELRKKGKELRYLLELFGAPTVDPELVKALIRTLKGLQDVLGLHQDREVQIATLRELGHELVGRPGGAQALMAIGTLIERLEADAAEARAQFAAAFGEFAAKSQCRLLAKAFS